MLHRETSASTTAYRRPAVYFYLTDFSMMSNWNIVCNTNIHYILKYVYDILMNNIYIKKSISLKTFMHRCRIRETSVLPEVSYTCLRQCI